MPELEATNIPESGAGGKFILLDYLRGIASLLVVLFHLEIKSSFEFVNKIIQTGEVGVQIFFVVSGYVIYQSMERHLKLGARGTVLFLKKRFWRIYPAFWASLVLSLIVFSVIKNQVFSTRDILSSATLTYPYLDGKAPQILYWTLVYEQQFYLVMALLILPFLDKVRTWILLLSSLIAVGNELGYLSNSWINNTLPNHWFEFLTGILVYMVHHDIRKKTALCILIVLVLVGISGNYRTIAAAITGVLLFLLYPFGRMLEKPYLFPLQFLGKISYSLYLFHLPVFAVVGLWTGSPWAALAASLLTAAVCYTVFEAPFLSAKRQPEPYLKKS